MRIAVDIRALTDPFVTGIGFYTRHLVEAMIALAPEDEFVLFASGRSATLDRLPEFRGKNVRMVKVPLPNRLLFGLLRFPGGPTLEYFLPEKPDVWLFPKFNVTRTSLPYVVTVHDLAFALFPQFITPKERLHNHIARIKNTTRDARRILAISQSTASDLQTLWGIDPANIAVTPLGVDHNLYTPKEQPSDKTFTSVYNLYAPYILGLATHEPRKNFESILEAYGLFRARGGAHFPLVLAGAPGWKNRGLNELFASHQYKKDIHFLGYVPEKHKPALYRRATAFVFPSFYEGFGLPVLEAMACGTPVITSNTSSLPEVAGTAALLIDPFNVHDFAAALQEIVDNPRNTARTMFAQRGPQQAAQFTWEKTAKLTLEALKAAV